jgi:hypothetical protein
MSARGARRGLLGVGTIEPSQDVERLLGLGLLNGVLGHDCRCSLLSHPKIRACAPCTHLAHAMLRARTGAHQCQRAWSKPMASEVVSLPSTQGWPIVVTRSRCCPDTCWYVVTYWTYLRRHNASRRRRRGDAKQRWRSTCVYTHTHTHTGTQHTVSDTCRNRHRA